MLELLSYTIFYNVFNIRIIILCTILDPLPPDFSSVDFTTGETFVELNPQWPITAVRGNIDQYHFDNSTFANAVASASGYKMNTTQSFSLTGLQPGTQYNLSFFSWINACNGVRSKSAQTLQMCTSE